MGTESSKNRQLLAPHEHVDRINLDKPNLIEQLPTMPPINFPGRLRPTKPLSTQRNPPSRIRRNHSPHAPQVRALEPNPG